VRLPRADKLGARMRPARPHNFRRRHARTDALASRMRTGSNDLRSGMRPATGIDDLRSRPRAGVRPARRNKWLGRRRTTSWMLLWQRTPAATMVLIVLGRSPARHIYRPEGRQDFSQHRCQDRTATRL